MVRSNAHEWLRVLTRRALSCSVHHRAPTVSESDGSSPFPLTRKICCVTG